MEWSDFVASVQTQLESADLHVTFTDEHDLTKAIALHLRKLFSDSFGVPDCDLPYHVVYRQGEEAEDLKAWTLIKRVKWVNVRGLNFVPDVLLMQPRLRAPTDDPLHVLPIEVKLVKDRACSAELARGVGQCLAYSVRYPKSILFVGVAPGVVHGARGLRRVTAENETSEDTKFRQQLEHHGIALIQRDVGPPVPRSVRT